MWWIKRKWLHLRAQILKEKRPPEFIARGWALGMFIGCAVPFGVQLCVSIPLSFVLKCSRVGATLGTLITNPLTIFFIYPAQTWLADQLLGGNLSYENLRTVEWSFATVKSLGGELIAAFLLGGFILAFILSPLTYWGVLKLVRGYRLRKETRRASLAKEQNGQGTGKPTA